MTSRQYELAVLQDGTLPLQLDGRVLPSTEHVCTSVIVWPANTTPEPAGSLIVDPCFSISGLREASGRLRLLGTALDRIGRVHVTHGHGDHMPTLPGEHTVPEWVPFADQGGGPLQGIRCRPCPGHSPDLVALSFTTKDGECWVVGDAIINEVWLKRWGYYWPNGYAARQICRTWSSVAGILSNADVVVPGHGPPFRVTDSLLEETMVNWPSAEHSSMCPGVEGILRCRLETLRATGSHAHADAR